MPPSERRRSSFGGAGSLLGPVKPIPDDDPPEQPAPAPAAEPEPEQTVPAPAPEQRAAPPEPEPGPEQRAAEPAPEPSRRANRGGRPMARRRRGKDDEAPTTVRLSDRAGAALWEAFVEAKREDPFLTYVEYASGIVEGGLDRERRRRNR